MSTENRPSPDSSPRSAPSFWVYVPPPLLFVAAFATGVQLDHLVPGVALPAAIVPTAWAVGVLAMACGALMVIAAPALFLIHRTTIIPHATSRALVTGGPFRITRNPMYLALVTGYIGIALVLNLAWPLLLLCLPLWIMSTKVIPCEECALASVFGDEYRAYQQRVRRWI